MDNTLLSGILSSLATLVGAIIGAIATIVAALMSKTYADKQIGQLKTSDEIKPLTRGIIEFLSLFRVTGASVFTARRNKAHIDSETGITITVRLCLSDRVDFEYHLPGRAKPQRVPDAKIGWKILVNYENNMYALTLVQVDPYVSAKFDFRKINNLITEVIADDQAEEND